MILPEGDALQKNLQTGGAGKCPQERREGQTCEEECCECLFLFDVKGLLRQQMRILKVNSRWQQHSACVIQP